MNEVNQESKNMLDTVPKLSSGVIKALLIAGAALISTFGVVFFNLDAVSFMSKANLLIDASIAFGSIAAPLGYAAWARIHRPNPPLSQNAVEKRVEMVADGRLKTIDHPSQSSSAKK